MTVTRVGVNCNIRTSRFKHTPAHLAAFQGHPQCLLWLLQYGAELNAQVRFTLGPQWTVQGCGSAVACCGQQKLPGEHVQMKVWQFSERILSTNTQTIKILKAFIVCFRITSARHVFTKLLELEAWNASACWLLTEPDCCKLILPSKAKLVGWSQSRTKQPSPSGLCGQYFLPPTSTFHTHPPWPFLCKNDFCFRDPRDLGKRPWCHLGALIVIQLCSGAMWPSHVSVPVFFTAAFETTTAAFQQKWHLCVDTTNVPNTSTPQQNDKNLSWVERKGCTKLNLTNAPWRHPRPTTSPRLPALSPVWFSRGWTRADSLLQVQEATTLPTLPTVKWKRNLRILVLPTLIRPSTVYPTWRCRQRKSSLLVASEREKTPTTWNTRESEPTVSIISLVQCRAEIVRLGVHDLCFYGFDQTPVTWGAFLPQKVDRQKSSVLCPLTGCWVVSDCVYRHSQLRGDVCLSTHCIPLCSCNALTRSLVCNLRGSIQMSLETCWSVCDGDRGLDPCEIGVK